MTDAGASSAEIPRIRGFLLKKADAADGTGSEGQIQLFRALSTALFRSAVHSLEAYTFVPNVRSDEELGRYVVVAGQLHGDRRFPEEAWPYLDFAKIGAEYFAGPGGAYTVSGYVMRREDGQQQVQESMKRR